MFITEPKKTEKPIPGREARGSGNADERTFLRPSTSYSGGFLADNRSQQLGVLRKWARRGALCAGGTKPILINRCALFRTRLRPACQEVLLKWPSILILDEGHTSSENQGHRIMSALAKSSTPARFVLSGDRCTSIQCERGVHISKPSFVPSVSEVEGGRRAIHEKNSSNSFNPSWEKEHKQQNSEHTTKGDSWMDLPGPDGFSLFFLKLSSQTEKTQQHGIFDGANSTTSPAQLESLLVNQSYAGRHYRWLVASRIVELDVHLNPPVIARLIGRAFRPGQVKIGICLQLVASGHSPEEEDHFHLL
nr:protein CHROMATIN REMODELING 35 isoform X1 [Ipomoea batatas]